MRISFLFYLDDLNIRRVRPRVIWGVGGFLLGTATTTLLALLI